MPKKQKSGLYRAHVRIGVDDNGKPIEKWLSARTKAELDRKRMAVLAGYVGGYEPRAVPMAVDYIIEWFETFKAPYIGRHSQEGYRTLIDNYVLPPLDGKRLGAVTRQDLQRIMNSLSGRASSYIDRASNVLHSVFTMAYTDGLVSHDLTVGLRRPAAKQRVRKRALTAEENALVASLAETRPWLAVLYYTGMRGGEMRALQWKNIDLKRDVIHIVDSAGVLAGEFTGGKTVAALRDVPVCAQLHAILARFPSTPETFVTGGEMIGAVALLHRWRALGLPEDITVHCLRHNFISMCYNKVDMLTVSRIVGHSSIKVTADIYTHLDQSNRAPEITDIFSGGSTKGAQSQ